MQTSSNTLVLVTGGSGFLGAHCVLQLLNQGYNVRTSLRTLSKQKTVRQMLMDGGAASTEKLTFAEADLAHDTGWEEAIKGCSFVLHIASPFPFKMPKDENEVIKPAVEGTLRVLEASRKQGVKRVVLTSSIAAIGYSHSNKTVALTEEHWTNPDDPHISAYVKSKTLAEKAAWDFIEKDESGMELSVICPRYILGPTLGTRLTTSLTVLKQLFDGSMKAKPDISYGIIDVRDVADLHIKAMTDPRANKQRFLASSGEPMTFHDIALFLKDQFGEKAAKTTTKVYPNWLIRLMVPFNPAARGIRQNLGKVLVSHNEKATALLGWVPRSRKETILDSINRILAIESEEES